MMVFGAILFLKAQPIVFIYFIRYNLVIIALFSRFCRDAVALLSRCRRGVVALLTALAGFFSCNSSQRETSGRILSKTQPEDF
jgi:hypothetical protein